MTAPRDTLSAASPAPAPGRRPGVDAPIPGVHPGVAPDKLRRPYSLGSMPLGRTMITVDEARVAAPPSRLFELAWKVEEWPAHLAHYRFVRFRARTRDGGGLVEMSADRPFGPANWPTWWLSEMEVDHDAPSIRFRHVEGITRGMEVEWSFEPVRLDDGREGTHVRVVHAWDGPHWPLGPVIAVAVIGPVFIHGIASRTVAGLQRAAEASPAAHP